MPMTDEELMRRALELAREGMEARRGGPFGCVVAKDGVVIGEGSNRVTSANDPTAHAEIVAIRDACAKIEDFSLEGCSVYTSCEPCPMCLAAIYWSRADRVFYAGTRRDAAEAGFDDEMLYEELALPIGGRRLSEETLMRESARELFREWVRMPDKIPY